MSISDIDIAPTPTGELSLQTVAMPRDTNPRGDIFAGWLVSQMDNAAAIAALQVNQGRIATVAINGMHFLSAVHVGAVVSCYTQVLEIGRTSMRIGVEVWIKHKQSYEPVKVTEGQFVFVCLDENGRTRAIKPQDS
jgi:acyl-CoA thioesterase YciA